MSNDNYWDDEDDDMEPEIIGDNDLLKKLRKAKRADEKRIKELTEQLESLSKVQRENTVKEVLEKKGVNPKAARLILKDLDSNISVEAVNAWLEDNADLLGIQTEKSSANTEDLAALRQQDSLVQNAITPDKAQDLEMRLNNAASEDEILSILRSQ